MHIAELLKGHVKWLKIGLQLFVSCGPDIVRNLRALGFEIFLDLKFYDIPNTVANAVRSACDLDISMLTVHAQGGKKMCQAALEASADFSRPPIVACVTVLTSFGEGEVPGIAVNPAQFAMELATEVASWNMPAIVCSPMEVAQIKQIQPQLKCICPGIRPEGFARNDQQRAMSPSEAVANGADFLVLGRPVLQSPDPLKTVAEIIHSMKSAL